MGAGASAAALSDLNDEDAAILEARYLKLKLGGASGQPLLKLLEHEFAELADKKARAELAAEVAAEAEAAMAITASKVAVAELAAEEAAAPQTFDQIPVVEIPPQAPTLPDPSSEASPEKTSCQEKAQAYRTLKPAIVPPASPARRRPSDFDRTRVANLMRIVSFEAWSNFMVSVDGSKLSKMAIEVCLEELMSSKDGLIALHCFDSTKEDAELLPRFHPDALKDEVEVALMTRTGKGRYALKWVDKTGDSTSNTVVRTVNEITLDRDKFITTSKHQKSMEAPSYFVTGAGGRKNEKMGSLPLLAAGKLHLPNIIVKKPPVVERGRVFVVSVKNLSQKGLYDIALDLMKPGKGDRLVVLHLYAQSFYQGGSHFAEGEAPATTARLEKQFTDLFTSDGVQGRFVSVEHKGATMSAILLKAIAKEEADYVIIQPSLKQDGNDVSFLTRDIITQADCNIVCCHH